MMLTLTEQQQAVVEHNHGPALVFAVAGAGKTTAMVHRIERLVRDGFFAPNQILATSFGRANIADLRRAVLDQLNGKASCAIICLTYSCEVSDVDERDSLSRM